MSLLGVGGILHLPSTQHHVLGMGWVPAVKLLDAGGEKCAFIFQAPKTGTISKICWRSGVVMGCANGASVAINGVNVSTGAPDGADYGGSIPGTQGGLATNTTYWTALGAGAVVTQGTVLAVVITFAGFQTNDVLNVEASRGYLLNTCDFPYVALFAASAWTKDDWPGSFSLEYCAPEVAVVEAPGACWPSATQNYSWRVDTNPNKRGNLIRLPFPCRVEGFWLPGALHGDTTVSLYDSDGYTVLASLTLNSNVRGTSGDRYHEHFFSAPVMLEANTTYYLVVAPALTISITLCGWQLLDDGALRGIDALPLGQNCAYVTLHGTVAVGNNFKDHGTTDLTQRLWLGLLVDQLGGSAPEAPTLSARDDRTGTSVTLRVEAEAGVVSEVWGHRASSGTPVLLGSATGSDWVRVGNLTQGVAYLFHAVPVLAGVYGPASNLVVITPKGPAVRPASLADAVAEYLETQELGTRGTDLFSEARPDTPDEVLVVRETGGPGRDPFLPLELATVQVTARAATGARALELLDGVVTALSDEGAPRLSFYLDEGGAWFCHLVEVQGRPGVLGLDERGKFLASVNVLLTVERR